MPRTAALIPCAPPHHPLFNDLTGQKFSRLTVLKYAGRIGGEHAFLCRCDCGGEIVTRGYLVSTKVTRSCGCLLADKNREIRTTHGLSWTREWRIWSGMKTRCSNSNTKSFKNYGGRGIRVCDRWLYGDGERGGFECFYIDMGPRPSRKHSINRIDNDGNYQPNNCCWALQSEQAINTQVMPRVTWRGATRTAHEWATITGIDAAQIEKRIGRGWSPERALTQSVRGRK